MCPRADLVFILERHFASKSFAAVRETFLDTGSVYDRQRVRGRTVLTDGTLRYI
jgi:hypothetical protein